jgi:uncharacterized protein (TIGR02453 family)
MAAAKNTFFGKETFQFFRELKKNNRKEWMDENRERYQSLVMKPFRLLLEEMTPALQDIDERFDLCGRTGPNFSRINRDIRFAKDKTIYKTQMYLKCGIPAPEKRETGQLYMGMSIDSVTAGFRIYSGGKRKESTLALVAQPRMAAKPAFVAQQKARLRRKYDSYWYTTEKGEWTKHEGWPSEAENWKKLQAWIVRKKWSPDFAQGKSLDKELVKVFREVYPLLEFTSIP